MDTKKSIELLNKGVADELAAIHQYMYWHFHLDDQGFGPLSVLFKRVAIAEMNHAEGLAERILFLKGDVEMVAAHPVEKITEPADMLKRAAEMEAEAQHTYNDYASQCAANSDSGTKRVFEALVADEEQHFEQFDQQLDNISRFGPSYLALQSFAAGTGETSET